MAIDEKTREQRVMNWTAQKNVWELGLSKVTNENDEAVARSMIGQAEAALKRLGVKEESRKKPVEITGVVDAPKKKVANTDGYSHKVKDITDAAQ